MEERLEAKVGTLKGRRRRKISRSEGWKKCAALQVFFRGVSSGSPLYSCEFESFERFSATVVHL